MSAPGTLPSASRGEHESSTLDPRASQSCALDPSVLALHRQARTFELERADPADSGTITRRPLPTTLTLVTPDHDRPERDHLFVGPHAVPSRNLRYTDNCAELSFRTSDGEAFIRGHLRLLGSRTRALGAIEFAGCVYAVAYGVKRDDMDSQVAGLYHLHADPRHGFLLLSVHDGQLYVDQQPVRGARIDDGVLCWNGLPDAVSHLPKQGFLQFSRDGERILASSFGKTGERVHPDAALEVATQLQGSEGVAAALLHAASLPCEPGQTLADLIALCRRTASRHDALRPDPRE